jgi:antitoxin component YwqK of YwqJK toxin-antitoxin module
MGIGMKNILTIIIILMGTITYGQSYNTKYEMVSDNLVKKTTYMNGRVDQSGYYIVINNNMMKHGEWKLYHNGRVLSKAKFDKGNLVWIDTNDGRITSDQIKVRKLEHKVERLERMLIASEN